MKNLPSRACHHDQPVSRDSDVGAELRQRAEESCGYSMGKDLFDAMKEIEANGGPEAILHRALKRVERGDR